MHSTALLMKTAQEKHMHPPKVSGFVRVTTDRLASRTFCQPGLRCILGNFGQAHLRYLPCLPRLKHKDSAVAESPSWSLAHTAAKSPFVHECGT